MAILRRWRALMANSGYNGDGVAATNASFELAYNVAVGRLRQSVYCGFTITSRIRKVATNGIITTWRAMAAMAIQATAAWPPVPVCAILPEWLWTPSGNLFMRIQPTAAFAKWPPTALLRLLAGNGSAGYSGDGDTATECPV